MCVQYLVVEKHFCEYIVIIELKITSAGEDTCAPEGITGASAGRQHPTFQRMTMDGMEVMGSQPHAAATSPFLLSSPPLGHHHHHHATFNLQTVQLSFDACLTYNAVTSAAGLGGTSSLTTNTSKAAVPTLSLGNCTPLHHHHQQQQVTTTDSPDGQQALHRDHANHHDHHHPHHHRHEDHHRLHSDVDAPTSPGRDHDIKRHSQRLEDERIERINDCRDSLQDQNEKDKAGDLNTPVTTSSDLPSFFGPSALVEPPPITGIPVSFKRKIKN